VSKKDSGSPVTSMLTERLDVSFSLVWTLAIANVLGAGLLLAWGKQVARVTFVPGHYLVPAIVLFVFMGAWIGGSSLGDWISLLLFGLVGWAMKQAGWPRPPLVLGYILGTIMENALQIASQTHGWGILTRPISLVILVLGVLTLVLAYRRYRRDASSAVQGAQGGESSGGDPRVSLGVDVVLFAAFAYAVAVALSWAPSPRLFPLVAAVPALPLVALALVMDWRSVAEKRVPAPTDGAPMRRGVMFYGWMVAILFATLVIGQYLALLTFVALYLIVWARAGWHTVAIYTALSAAFLYGLFDRMVPVMWYQSPFFSLLG